MNQETRRSFLTRAIGCTTALSLLAGCISSGAESPSAEITTTTTTEMETETETKTPTTEETPEPTGLTLEEAFNYIADETREKTDYPAVMGVENGRHNLEYQTGSTTQTELGDEMGTIAVAYIECIMDDAPLETLYADVYNVYTEELAATWYLRRDWADMFLDDEISSEELTFRVLDSGQVF